MPIMGGRANAAEENIGLSIRRYIDQNGLYTILFNHFSIVYLDGSLYKDVLIISDLNIEKPGDGFAVIAAMKVKQSRCANTILTAYPDFDTAQQAIRLRPAPPKP